MTRYAAFLLPLALLAASPALASQSQSRLNDVPRQCVREVARLCPALQGTRQPRNQAICLRPYRASLSSGCRRAVRAATS